MPLHLIIGSMFSGKTETIISIARRYTAINKKVLFINHILDQRYNKDHVTSHNGTKQECLSLEYIKDLSAKLIKDHDVIIIEESQFFTDLYQTFRHFHDTELLLHKSFVVAGLSGDYRANKFGEILDLIPFCDKLEKLSGFCAICKDETLGHFTKLLDNSLDSKQIIVGAGEKYHCVCRKCFYNK